MRHRVSGEALLQLIDRCLREGSAVDIDGMGRFELDGDRVVFQPDQKIRVFLAYAEEDRVQVKRLCRALRKAGFEPWMDKERLLPGQNWPRAIERAIELSDFFLGCFSRRSTLKRGHFQCELRYALDLAARVPLEEIFFVPVRLNECDVPRQIAGKVQYVDLFPDWESGIARLAKMMRRQTTKRKSRLKLVG